MFEAIDIDVHKHQLVLHRQHLFQARLQIFLAVNAHTDMTIGFRQLDEVRQGFHIGP